MIEAMVVLIAFALGFWIGRWWERSWHDEAIDPHRREWRL